KNFSLFSSFSPNLNWFKNKNTDFELQISNDLSSTIPENIDIYEKEKSILKENTFIIKKIIGPQIDYNNFSSRYLYIDDVKISKRLYESKNYWDVDPKTFENILGIDTVTGRFYSTLQNSPDFLKLSPTTIENDYENFYNQAKLNASKEFSIIRDLSNIDKKDIKLELNKFIYVDQVQKKSFINNNIIYWNINPKTIKFASNDHTHFWTSISNITASDIETYNISYYDFFGKFDDWSVILKSEIIPPRIDKVNLVYDDYLILEPHWNFQSNNYNYSIDAYRKMYPSRATKFKYYSQKSNLIYSSIDHILASSHNISEFNQLPDDIINSNLKVFHDDENSINNITDKQNIDDYLNNNINSESKIVKKWLARPTISIDGINVGLFLFNEKFYVNFDISNIKYVALDKVKNEYQYFTSKDLIPSNLVSDIEIYAYSGEGQPSIKSILNPSVGANQRMRMKINNGIVINAVIDSNQLVWDFSDTNFQLSDIKYVDNNNNYYTDPILKIIENSGGSMPKGLSSVKQMNSIQVKPPVDSKLLNPVISNNIDEINQYDNIFIDSIQYKRRVYRSLVNWVSDNSEIADISYIKYQLISKFADGSSSETNYFFTNIKNAKDYSEENYLNGNTRITNNITPSMNYKPFLLEAPTAADQKLIISNGNENDTEVKVIKKNNEFYWDDKQKELISKIKFVNEDKFGNLKYYVNLNSNKSDEYNSVTDVEISPDIFAKTNAENKEDKKDLINNKKNTLYIFVGIIGLIGIVSITMFIFKIKSIKGGK
ncbi:MAG: hypothetical protein HRT99_04270, partial [Mycoplasmatales bacterium]|nr:hypothetical protein [Mycoplasmatales bacterium]